MSLLDDLEEQALAKSESDKNERKAAVERDRAYSDQLQPTMAALAEYLTKLCEHLNFLGKSKPAEFAIAGYGRICGTVEPRYEVNFERNRTDCAITVVAPCLVERSASPEVEIKGESTVKALSQTLQELRLAGNMQLKRDVNGQVLGATFQVNGQIECQARIEACLTSPDIKMTFTNFGQFGSRVKSYKPDQITDELRDQLGRFLARESDTLLTEQVSDEYRKQLQQRLEQQKLRQKWEAKLNEEESERGSSVVGWNVLGERVNRVVTGTKSAAWELLRRGQKSS